MSDVARALREAHQARRTARLSTIAAVGGLVFGVVGLTNGLVTTSQTDRAAFDVVKARCLAALSDVRAGSVGVVGSIDTDLVDILDVDRLELTDRMYDSILGLTIDVENVTIGCEAFFERDSAFVGAVLDRNAGISGALGSSTVGPDFITEDLWIAAWATAGINWVLDADGPAYPAGAPSLPPFDQ